MALKNFWKLNISVWVSLALALSSGAFATPRDLYSFTNKADQERFTHLTKELRCLVCQNQSIADSDATLARDLRDKVFAMVNEHQSDQAIREFLVKRYGEFILFSPPVREATLLLWGFPGLMLLAVFGGVMVWRRRVVAV